MIHVLATIRLNPGTRAAFLKEFLKLVPLVHAEDGCIEYGPAIDIASGSPMQEFLGEDAVIVVEKWASVDHLKAHSQAPHMADYRVAVKDYVAGVQLRVLQPVA
jgi:quinol monooxygenase YgiN